MFANGYFLLFQVLLEKITSEMVLYQQNFRSTEKENVAQNSVNLS